MLFGRCSWDASSPVLAPIVIVIGIVYVTPVSSSTTTTTFSKRADDSNRINAYPNVPTFQLTSSTSQVLQLSSDLIDIRERTNQSLWDLMWTWPSISGLGRWEWYCPDDLCGGPGWNQFSSTPISFPHSWIVTNAVRWNSIGAPSAQISVNANGTIYGQSLNITLTLKTTSGTTNSSIKTLPSSFPSSSNECKGIGIQLSSSGKTKKEIKIPFGIFSTQSPIRPICLTQTVNPGSNTKFGDFLLTSTQTTSILFSSLVDIDNSTRFPKGFKPIRFVGQSSTTGVAESAISISLSGEVDARVTLVTPPVQYPDAILIKDKSTFLVLQYDTSNGNMNPIAVTSWNSDQLSPARATVTLPGTGIYIFGYLNTVEGTSLPAFYGNSIPYLSAWGTKEYVFSNVNMSVKATKDLLIALNPAQVITTSKQEVSSPVSIGFDTSDNPEIYLIYERASYVWARFIPSQATVGGSWQPISSTRTGSTVIARISSPGTYGVLPYIAPNSGEPAQSRLDLHGSTYWVIGLLHMILFMFQ